MKAPQELFESSSTELYLSEIQRKISSGERKIDLDFSQCQAISAYTLARLISLQKENEGSETKITINQMQTNILSMIKALHLDKLLVIK
jgi:ABC-type transporter Mla MlaB component